MNKYELQYQAQVVDLEKRVKLAEAALSYADNTIQSVFEWVSGPECPHSCKHVNDQLSHANERIKNYFYTYQRGVGRSG